jgi:hypothetical protein
MKPGLLTLTICSILICCISYAQTGAEKSTSKTKKMKQFSLLIRVPDSYTSAQAKTVGPQWDELIAKWKTEGVYVLSFAFPGESYTVSGKGKEIKKETVLSDNLKVVSNIVIKAENIQHAVELAKSCPILSYGGKVETREIPKPIQVTISSR